jgi:hypothetical protein
MVLVYGGRAETLRRYNTPPEKTTTPSKMTNPNQEQTNVEDTLYRIQFKPDSDAEWVTLTINPVARTLAESLKEFFSSTQKTSEWRLIEAQ